MPAVTTMQFVADPHEPMRRIWVYPRGPARTTLAALVALVLLSATLLGAIATYALVPAGPGPSRLSPGESLALFATLAGFGTFVGLLARHLARDLQGKWRGSIAIRGNLLTLDLAPFRSLSHGTARFSAAIHLTDLVAIESRLEAYAGFAMAMVNRSYRLVRRGGEPIFLFEDRAIGSDVEGVSHRNLAEEIARCAGVRLRELGMASGRLGFLGIAGVRAPAWNDAPLSDDAEQTVWRKVWFTGAIAAIALVVAVVIRVCAIR